MNKYIFFFLLGLPISMLGMDELVEACDMDRNASDLELDNSFNQVMTSIVEHDNPQYFLKNATPKKPKIQYLNLNKFRVVEGSEVIYTGQIFDIPTPNTNEHKGSKRSVLTANDDDILNHMLEESTKRLKTIDNDNKNNIQQVHDF